MKAGIIDYDVGNLFSMSNALRRAGLEAEIIRDPVMIKEKDAIILPGVGNFGIATAMIEPFRQPIMDATESGTPLLGSCLGMQLLFESSEESEGDGLGLVDGRVRLFRGELKVPHMGWNTIKTTKYSPLLEGIDEEAYFYFVHSYYTEPVKTEDTLTTTEYGFEFTSMIEKDNIFGAQFHPEKSGKVGAMLLKNFARLVKK